MSGSAGSSAASAPKPAASTPKPATSTPKPAKPSVIKKLSKEAFEKHLDYLEATGVFNEDSPCRAKGLRQHVKRLLYSWEKEREEGVFLKAPTTVYMLKRSLKNSRGK